MAKRAQLEDGTILEFPDDTADEVMDRAVQEHLSGSSRRYGAKDIATGVADIAVSGLRGLVNEPATTLAGLFGAVNPSDTYMDAKGRARADIEADRGIVSSERLRTPQGENLAMIIGATPSVQRMTQVLEALGQGLENVAGPEVRDVVESGLTLATMRSPRGAGGRAPAAADAINKMRNDGFTVPSHTPAGPAGATAGTASERTLAGVAGGERVDAIISVQNQDVASRWMSRGAHLGTEFTEPKSLTYAIKQAEIPYEEIRKAGIEVKPDMQLLQDAARIVNDAGQVGTSAVRAVRDLTQPLTPGGVIDSVRKLRQQGFKRLSSDNVEAQEIGELQIAAAEALDAVLDRSLKNEGAAAAKQGDVTLARTLERLHSAYINGRAWRSDLHVLEDVMNPTTGAISAQKLARIADRRNVNPHYQRVVDAFRTSPYAMQDLAPASRTAQVGTLDVAMAGGVTTAVRSAAGLGTVVGAMLGRKAAQRAAASPGSRRLAEARARNRRLARRGIAVGVSVNNEEQRQ